MLVNRYWCKVYRPRAQGNFGAFQIYGGVWVGGRHGNAPAPPAIRVLTCLHELCTAVLLISFTLTRKRPRKPDTARVSTFGRGATLRSYTTHPLCWVTLGNAKKLGTLFGFQNSGAYTAFCFYVEFP